jgi:glutathione peroxidase
MRTLVLIFIMVASTIVTKAQENKSFYDLKSVTLDGQVFDFSVLKGKKVLIVNTASKCGYTPQYAQLEILHKTYGGKNFILIGFPANNFLSQEPGSNDEIKAFCTKNYGVSFQMMSKISVKGKDMDPVYKWLTLKSQNGVMDAPVKWNFQKFMIDENGHLAGMAAPGEIPTSDRIIGWIKTGKLE